MSPRPARAAGGSTAATLPGRSSRAAWSSARARRGRARKSSSSSGATPDFVGSPDRFTSTSAGISSRCAADSDAASGQSSQQLVHDSRLSALQVADEVPAERVAVAFVLRLEILRPVLAHHLDARVDEDSRALERDVLRRGDHGDSGAGLGADRARSARGSRQPATTPTTPWRPVTARVAPVREEELRVARTCRRRSARPS